MASGGGGDASAAARAGRIKTMGVKNKAAAPVQVTAEQILREAMERREPAHKKPMQKITDQDELQDFRLRKRKEYEDVLRRSPHSIGVWYKYAEWEASQFEFERSRSVFERCIELDYRNPGTWIRYAETEMKNRFVNHARNVWDRAVSLLPRVDQLWLKYTHMEEMLGNIAGARQIYERWMKWRPAKQAWTSYVNAELRHSDGPQALDRARDIYSRFLVCHPDVESYIKFARFEERNAFIARAREIYERCNVELGDEIVMSESRYFSEFAKFEERCGEYDRAKAIYKFALERLPKSQAHVMYTRYVALEKQRGDAVGVENIIIHNRRQKFEEEINENPKNYDVWFDYLRMERTQGHSEEARIRDLFERAIAQLPPIEEKQYWRRYIYLWINYAIFEELEAKDIERTRNVYRACLDLIPHQSFTFSKLWIMAAHFELRHGSLEAARKLFGLALGRCPKEKLLKSYIELELQLGCIDRCRKLYERYLELMPENCFAWSRYAEIEASLQEDERARAIFELAVSQQLLDMPEVLWKSYIDFEVSRDEHDRVRDLYSRLLERTKHVKVWISRAQFEASIDQPSRAREVFDSADIHFKCAKLKEERVLLLESWLDFEKKYGDASSISLIEKRMPRRVKKRRLLTGEAGRDAGWEEYYDYIFPDEDRVKSSNLTILERARQWKKQKLQNEAT